MVTVTPRRALAAVAIGMVLAGASAAPPAGAVPRTGAPTRSSVAHATAGYRDPLRGVKHLESMRVDEGVDYGGSGPIYAIGAGVVTSTKGPWPEGTYLTYRLTVGRAKGDLVYVAENVKPKVKVGEKVTSTTVVGELRDAYPDMEIGWSADAYGDTMAAVSHQWDKRDNEYSIPSAFGVNFNQFLVALGAPSGVMVHPKATGKVPADWPRWPS